MWLDHFYKVIKIIKYAFYLFISTFSLMNFLKRLFTQNTPQKIGQFIVAGCAHY